MYIINYKKVKQIKKYFQSDISKFSKKCIYFTLLQKLALHIFPMRSSHTYIQSQGNNENESDSLNHFFNLEKIDVNHYINDVHADDSFDMDKLKDGCQQEFQILKRLKILKGERTYYGLCFGDFQKDEKQITSFLSFSKNFQEKQPHSLSRYIRQGQRGEEESHILIQKQKIALIKSQIQAEAQFSQAFRSGEIQKFANKRKTIDTKIKSKEKPSKSSIGRNPHQHFGKACQAYLKKFNFSKDLMNKRLFVKNNFIIPISSRANIVSYFIVLYYFCKSELKQQSCQKTKSFIQHMKKNLQNYIKKRAQNTKQSVKENIKAKKKIINFLDQLIDDITLLEDMFQIQEKVIQISFKSESGKLNDKIKIKKQIEQLYQKITQQKDYSQIFQAQKTYIKKQISQISDSISIFSEN